MTSNHLVLVKAQGKICLSTSYLCLSFITYFLYVFITRPVYAWNKKMILIFSILTISVVLSLMILLVSFWLPQLKIDCEKLLPYECGFNPLSSARLPFSIRFFLVALLFLLFDLEIALLLPLPWGQQLDTPLITFIWASIVLTLLTLGFIYEWAQGGLEWAE